MPLSAEQYKQLITRADALNKAIGEPVTVICEAGDTTYFAKGQSGSTKSSEMMELFARLLFKISGLVARKQDDAGRPRHPLAILVTAIAKEAMTHGDGVIMEALHAGDPVTFEFMEAISVIQQLGGMECESDFDAIAERRKRIIDSDKKSAAEVLAAINKANRGEP